MYQKNTNPKRFALLAWAMLSVFSLLNACKKDEHLKITVAKAPQISGTKGVYVLCEGLWGMRNSTISYYDFETGSSEPDMYRKVNQRDLGETANDLQVYGSKMYAVVSGTQGAAESFLDVIDVATCKSLKRIPFNAKNDGYMPRYISFYKNKAYVSRYDGVISRIDTTSLEIDAELPLLNGEKPAGGLEQMAVANGKLYVSNSSHPYYPDGLKTKVSVIDLVRFKKIGDIEVGNNPVRIAAAANGDLYVMTWNDYIVFNDPTLVRIDSKSDQVVQTEKYDLGAMAISGDIGYATHDVYSQPGIAVLNTATGKLGDEAIHDGTTITTLYGLSINPFDKSFVVADAMGYNGTSGKAFVFDKNGQEIVHFTTGGLPQHAVFRYQYQ